MAVSSIASEKHPKSNEDSNYFNQYSFGVFDGMSGETNAALASSTCALMFKKFVQEVSSSITPIKAEEILKEYFLETNQIILEKIKETGKVTGSTGTYGIVAETGDSIYQAIIANIGDSRAYLLRDGVLIQLTNDDSAIKNYRPNDHKEIQKRIDNAKNINDLSPEDKVLFQYINKITKYFGSENSSPKTIIKQIFPCDILLLTTDGVHDNLTTDEIKEILSKNKEQDPSVIVKELTTQALFQSHNKDNFRHKPDDMTALVIKPCLNNELSKPERHRRSDRYL